MPSHAGGMTAPARRPLESMEDWDDDLRARCPTADHVFRDHAAEVRPSVKEFYRLNRSDTDLTQIEHLLQTAEAIRADGHPRWLVLTD